MPTRLLASGVAALLIAACSSTAHLPAKVPDPLPASGSYTVEPSDTLYGVASRHGLDFRQVAAWNGIRPPYLIYPGQRLRLTAQDGGNPSGQGAGGTAPSIAVATPPDPAADRQPALVPHPRKGQKRPQSGPTGSDQTLAWSWPARGRVVRRFAEGGSKGLDIRGSPEAPVRAAAAGRVVYSGSGLVGYGKLIIVRHNNTYLSAYGHNERVLVKEGDPVARGQRIAYMGRSGADGVKLHFEIRRNGKPVDPLVYLPSPSPPKEDSDV